MRPAAGSLTLRAMTNDCLLQLERLARVQAALTDDLHAKLALLELAEDYRQRSDAKTGSLEPFPEGWWASP